jgi:Zn-dependent protease with chaperone function
MIAAMLLIAAALLVLPHLARPAWRSAATSLVIWTVALGVRAASCLLLAACLVVAVPSTAPFAAMTDWCVEVAVPVLAAHVGVLGHQVGDVLSLTPFLALNVSALWVLLRIARGARTVRRLLARTAVGTGPGGTIILGGREVMLGAAGMLHPRVVVSAGALATLDDEELAAAIAHERAHIRRGHRFVAAFAELCGAIARPLPGTRRMVSEVHRQIERDADARAVGQAHDRAALASAICKSALSRAATPALALLAGAGVSERVEELLRGPLTDGPAGDRALRVGAIAGAVVLTLLTLAWAGLAVAGGLSHDAAEALRHACPSCGL